MRLIMAVSRDGYTARRPGDRMDWLGPFDKAVFRVLTGVEGRCAVSQRTSVSMPGHLDGRKLFALSRSGHWTLDRFHKVYPCGWLLGGQEIALSAIGLGLIDEAHICRSDRMAFPLPGQERYEDRVTDAVRVAGLTAMLKTKVGDVSVECWRRD